MSKEEAVMRYVTAKGYIQSAKMITLSEHYKKEYITTSILSIHLLGGFALELYYKSWLLGSGVSSKEVRNFRHDIKSLHDAAVGKELPSINGLIPLKDHLAGPHADFTFRYIEDGATVRNTNWPVAFQVFYQLDVTVDSHVGASASQGLTPGH